jgi:hypothetical protein
MEPCDRSPGALVRVTVEGELNVLVLCQGHLDWLRRFADEDPGVRVISAFPYPRTGHPPFG